MFHQICNMAPFLNIWEIFDQLCGDSFITNQARAYKSDEIFANRVLTDLSLFFLLKQALFLTEDLLPI